MKRLNNAVAQRNAAREELLLEQAKLKQMQDDINAGKLQLSRGPPATPESGHLIPSVGGIQQEEGVLDRMKRYMQSIPGASPIRDQNGGVTPLTPSGKGWQAREAGPAVALRQAACALLFINSALADAGRTADGMANDAGLSEMDRRQRQLYAKQQQLLREQRSADQDSLLTAISGPLLRLPWHRPCSLAQCSHSPTALPGCREPGLPPGPPGRGRGHLPVVPALEDAAGRPHDAV